jgi:hypothetical protein
MAVSFVETAIFLILILKIIYLTPVYTTFSVIFLVGVGIG